MLYEYKLEQKDSQLPLLGTLREIASDRTDKLHVLEARYLLGLHYHKKSGEASKTATVGVLRVGTKSNKPEEAATDNQGNLSPDIV